MVRKDVHTEHCCKKHGCKYSDSKCTVTTGKKPQSQQCETCEFEEESNRYELAELKSTVKTAEKTIDSSPRTSTPG